MNNLLVRRGNAPTVIKSEEGEKFEKLLRLNEMEMQVDPVDEWKERFTDA